MTAWAASAPFSAAPDAHDRDARARLARLRRLAWLVDGALRVPGTRFRFGLNSVIGLLPFGGDAVLALVSLYIVWEAHRLGTPRPVLARMLGNVGIEAAAGAVPWLGDLFDVAFKANLRNLALLDEHLSRAGARTGAYAGRG